MKKLILLTAAAFMMVAGLASGLIAGHHYHGSHGCDEYMVEMSVMDNNQDGVITFDEFIARNKEKLSSAFKMIDTDNDELLSAEEWDEFAKIHGIGEKYGE